jgi:hypothetical protein
MKRCTKWVYVRLMNLGTCTRSEHICMCDLTEGHAGPCIVIGAN